MGFIELESTLGGGVIEEESSYQKYDQVLTRRVGGFGRWQLVVFSVLAIPGIFKADMSNTIQSGIDIEFFVQLT